MHVDNTVIINEMHQEEFRSSVMKNIEYFDFIDNPSLKHKKHAPNILTATIISGFCDHKYFACNRLLGMKSKSKAQYDENTTTTATHDVPQDTAQARHTTAVSNPDSVISLSFRHFFYLFFLLSI